MDIRSYIKSFVPVPPHTRQFAVLAFDLGVEGADIHPPERIQAEFSDKINANGPSGPWCVRPLEDWQPVAELSKFHFETERRVQELLEGDLKVDREGKLKKTERLNVTTWGDVEKIHAEAVLMTPLAQRVDRYFKQWNKLPTSISLYSYFSPCPACVEYLGEVRAKIRNFGGARGITVRELGRDGVKSWFFVYDEAYVRDIEERPLPTVSRFGLTKDGYMNEQEAHQKAGTLKVSGWTVLHPD